VVRFVGFFGPFDSALVTPHKFPTPAPRPFLQGKWSGLDLGQALSLSSTSNPKLHGTSGPFVFFPPTVRLFPCVQQILVSVAPWVSRFYLTVYGRAQLGLLQPGLVAIARHRPRKSEVGFTRFSAFVAVAVDGGFPIGPWICSLFSLLLCPPFVFPQSAASLVSGFRSILALHFSGVIFDWKNSFTVVTFSCATFHLLTFFFLCGYAFFPLVFECRRCFFGQLGVPVAPQILALLLGRHSAFLLSSNTLPSSY